MGFLPAANFTEGVPFLVVRVVGEEEYWDEHR
jgi:hypothetical protein